MALFRVYFVISVKIIWNQIWFDDTLHVQKQLGDFFQIFLAFSTYVYRLFKIKHHSLDGFEVMKEQCLNFENERYSWSAGNSGSESELQIVARKPTYK